MGRSSRSAAIAVNVCLDRIGTALTKCNVLVLVVGINIADNDRRKIINAGPVNIIIRISCMCNLILIKCKCDSVTAVSIFEGLNLC